MADQTTPSSEFPEIQPTEPTSSTAYIQPVIGKMGWDTRPEYKGLFGLGTSPNNGVDFHVFLSFDGINFDSDDIDNIWEKGAKDRVKKEVDSATAEIPKAISAANDAVKRADTAVENSKANSDAIKAMAEANAEIRSDAAQAMKDAQSAAADVANQQSAISAAVSEAQSSVSAAQAAVDQASKQMSSDVAEAVKSATAAVDDVKVQVAANSAAIIKTNNSIELQSRSTNNAISTLKAAQGSMQAIAMDAKSNAIVATQTASAASVVASDAKSNVTVAMQTASEASIAASDAKGDAAKAVLTASGAAITASNANSQALQATVTASGAALTATNASSQALQVSAAADKLSAKLTQVESDTSGKITTATSAAMEATSKSIMTQVEKDITDKTNGLSEQFKTQIKQLSDGIDIGSVKKSIDALNKTSKTQAADIKTNADAIALAAKQTDVLNNRVTSQEAMIKTLPDSITNTVTKRVTDHVDQAGYAKTTDVQSRIQQEADHISQTITQATTTADGKTIVDAMQSVTKSIDGVTSAVLNADGSSKITQLSDAIQLQLQGKSLCTDIPDLQTWTGKENEWLPIANLHDINTVTAGTKVTLSFDYVATGSVSLLPQFNSDPWIPWGDINSGSVHTDGFKKEHYYKVITVADDSWQNSQATQLCLRCDGFKGSISVSNLRLVAGDDVQSKIDMLSNSISLRVAKGDVISQINQEAGGPTLISVDDGKGKLYLDADSTMFSGKAFIPDAAITNLNGDKITAGHISVPMQDDNGNTITLGNGGINIASALSTDSDGGKTGFSLNLSSSGLKFINHREDNEANNDYRFLQITPGVLHDWTGATDQVTKPSGLIIRVPKDYSSQLGPTSPGGFLAIGSDVTGTVGSDDKQIAIAYVNKKINGWEEGLNIHTVVYIKPYGVTDNSLRTGWVSFSNWDNGERYPAIVNNQGPMGGIAFPRSSKVTLFDSYGQAFWPAQKQFNTKGFQWGW